MFQSKIPVTTLYLTDAIRERFGDDLPRLVPVRIPSATKTDTVLRTSVLKVRDNAGMEMPSREVFLNAMDVLISGGSAKEASSLDSAYFLRHLDGATSLFVCHPQTMDHLLVHLGHCVKPLKAFDPVVGAQLTRHVSTFAFEGRDFAVPCHDFGDCPFVCRCDTSIVIAAGRECLATPDGHIVWTGLETKIENRLLMPLQAKCASDKVRADASQRKQVLSVHHAEVSPDGTLVHHFGWDAAKGLRFPALDRA